MQIYVTVSFIFHRTLVMYECGRTIPLLQINLPYPRDFFFFSLVSYGKVAEKNFLYSFLCDQPIWQSLRFWNAAYFDAVQCERARRPVTTR